MRLLLPVAEAFGNGGTEEVLDLVRKLEEDIETPLDDKYLTILNEIQSKHPEMTPQFNCLDGISKEKQEEITGIHKNMRKYVRGAAGKLG